MPEGVSENFGHPKIIELSQMDLDGDEWENIFDPNNEGSSDPFIDEGALASLFKLGDNN